MKHMLIAAALALSTSCALAAPAATFSPTPAADSSAPLGCTGYTVTTLTFRASGEAQAPGEVTQVAEVGRETAQRCTAQHFDSGPPVTARPQLPAGGQAQLAVIQP
ncbi:hypothetical protein [Deinococcus sp. SL84]|uniref:hypothetical protein n=1 Tax=Deinococcus sp. SL84 TaxID=2994663 RepID=UPI002276A84F|nr:hypothetical protein [Deinococcus sp. SL84]MCY1703846.1 hypothetical protein [Deinococcus sp. SL84]